MKRTKQVLKTRESKRKCRHQDVFPVAAFYTDENKEAYLLQVCSDCGESFY